MKNLALLILVCVQFMFVPAPQVEVRPGIPEIPVIMILAIRDTPFKSITVPSPKMGVMTKGSILIAYCGETVCIFEDNETFVLREDVVKFEWFKAIHYNL